MKQVSDFIPESIDVKSPVLFVGISPSTKTTSFKNGTFVRLKRWTDIVGLISFDFVNCIPDIINGISIADVDFDNLIMKCDGKERIVALGGFASRVLKLIHIPHMKIDHPSPRNRNINNPDYEECIIFKLKGYL